MNLMRVSLCVVVANMLEGDIGISEFEFQLSYYIHFWTNTLVGKGMDPDIPSDVG